MPGDEQESANRHRHTPLPAGPTTAASLIPSPLLSARHLQGPSTPLSKLRITRERARKEQRKGRGESYQTHQIKTPSPFPGHTHSTKFTTIKTKSPKRKMRMCKLQAHWEVKHLILEQQLQDPELSGYVLDNTSYTEATKMSHNPRRLLSPRWFFSSVHLDLTTDLMSLLVKIIGCNIG